jgi:hypothetical protein
VERQRSGNYRTAIACRKSGQELTSDLGAGNDAIDPKATSARGLTGSSPKGALITEGFDTLDLKEAKALLDELAS